MSFAATNIRGAFLNWRFAVKGIQNASRSFGADLRSSAMAASLEGPREGPGLVAGR